MVDRLTLAAVAVLVPLRLYGALVSGVADCDEVYNYWEGVHLLARSDGAFRRPLQTWEYAPNYALRSWAYVAPYAAVARLGDVVAGAAPLATFAFARCAGLAAPHALAEVALVRGVAARFGGGAAACALGLIAASAGLLAASNALLPSAAAATLAALSQARQLGGDRRGAVFFAVAATLWPGWPFVAVLFVPLFVSVVAAETAERGAVRGLAEVAVYGVVAGVIVGLPVAAFDAFAYGRLTSPLWNVFRYNATEGGDELYGVEPWTFYAKNLLLNANVGFLLFLGLVPIVAVRALLGTGDPRASSAALLSQAAPAALWLGLLLSRPHKEERFLFPALPSLYVAAAVALDEAAAIAANIGARVAAPAATRNAVRGAAVAAALLFGLSRVAATTEYYARPQMAAWAFAGRAAAQLPGNATVCVGGEWRPEPRNDDSTSLQRECSARARSGGSIHASRTLREMIARPKISRNEWKRPRSDPFVLPRWHRYASTFALPPNARLGFVKTRFDGQLPRLYGAQAPGLAASLGVAAADVSAHFNAKNAERPGSYVAPAACDVAVDLRIGDDPAPSLAAALEADGRAWGVAFSAPFLDAANTGAAARAFLVPGYSRRRAAWGSYAVLAPVP